MEKLIEFAKAQINDINLSEEYQRGNIKGNFKGHIEKLIATANNFSEKGISVLQKKDLNFSKRLHWELETYILENSEEQVDEPFLEELDEIEDDLRSVIESNLGSFYDEKNDGLNDLIEHSINEFITCKRYEPSALFHKIENPWTLSSEILTEKKLLHTFSKDAYYIKNVIGLNVKNNDSEEVEGSKLILVGKGKRKNFSKTVIRDVFGLRGHVLNLITENAPDSSKPINSIEIIATLRQQGITEQELTDTEIRGWLIIPLKKSGRIGSSKSGYFLLSSCSDLKVTYDSHMENFKGYLRSLENYRQIADRSECDSSLTSFSKPFERHIREMQEALNKFNS